MANESTGDITEALLGILRASNKPLMASEIAQVLRAAGYAGADRKVINSLFHGPLRGQVSQDSNYRWTLTEPASGTRQERPPTSQSHASHKTPAWSRFARYVDYYKGCVAEDEHPESVYPLFRLNRDFLCHPFGEEWGASGQSHVTIELDASMRDFAVQLRKRGSSGALFYGYPLHVEWVKSKKGWVGGFGIPLFLQTIDYTLNGNTLEMDLVVEWPRVNSGFLSKVFSSVEERRQFMQELGVLEADGPPPEDGLTDIVSRMESLGVPCEQAEPLVPGSLPATPSLADIATGGLYNRAVIVIGEKSKYTAGLDRELAQLKSASDSRLSLSALRLFFGESPSTPASSTPQGDRALYEVAPLNEEQRRAVKSALTQPLTVVTGPPGTGKSQVVTTILANAYLRGQRVLFTSRNHKAVDVVQERLNSLCGYPLAIRAGSKRGDRDLRSELLTFLTQMLSLNANPEDYDAENEARQAYEQVVKRRDALWTQMEGTRRARNRVDQCDRITEAAETQLGNQVWQVLSQSEHIPGSGGPTKALQLIQRHLRTDLGLFAQIGRWLGRAADFAAIKEQLRAVVGDVPLFGHPPSSDIALTNLAAWKSYVETVLDCIRALRAIADYREAMAVLKASPSVEAIAGDWGKLDAQLSEWGARLIGARGKLLPDRIKDQEHRRAFGEYKSVLQRLAGDQIGGRVYAKLMEEQEKLFGRISEVLPVWCVTNLSARGSLPFEAGLFDIVVIDEASQCDIASALPLFYRAKRAVVIGDPQQLSHISTIEKHREQQLQVKHGLTEARDMPYTFADNSLFDMSVTCAGETSVISLREHFRSHSDIIGFSNRQWYGESLRVCTDYRRLRRVDASTPGILWTDVAGRVQSPRGKSALNQEEAAAVVAGVEDLLLRREFAGTVGVVTPFRAQANRIADLLFKRLPASVTDRAALIVDTAHGFQGDERDVMFFSPCVGPDLGRGAKYFLSSTGNLFNVAITRARSLLHVVGNRDACSTCGVPFIEAFVSYVASLDHEPRQRPDARFDPDDPRVGYWEGPFFEALKQAGLNPVPQYPVNQYRLDFAIVQGDLRLDIEVDGELYHKDWDGARCKEDIIRDIRLSALGWTIKRFWVYRVRDEMAECVKEVVAALKPPYGSSR
jgi:very-short-patch-repair endonuclease